MTRSLATGPDAQWAAARDGRRIVLLAGGAAPPVGQLELASDDFDLAIVGPPHVLAVVTREPARVTIYEPPYLEAVAHLDLDLPVRIAAIAGPRLVLLSADGAHLRIVRTHGRALSVQKIEPGNPVELAVGLERNQVLFALLKKLEVWDAVSGRPLLRPQLALPPPPRTVGSAQGHLWATRSGSDEVFVFRLSDGRPFRHRVGTTIEAVVSHPASPIIVVVTAHGLVRLHCFAHSVLVIDAPPWTPGTPLALLVAGDDVALLGVTDTGEPWGIAVAGHNAPAVVAEAEPDQPARASADKPRAMGATAVEPAPGSDTRPAPGPASEPRPAPGPASEARRTPVPRSPGTRGWREPLAAYGAELARGLDSELPIVTVETELGELAHRLALSAPARRALTALYALHLVGEPALAIARLGRALGDWTEALGQGDLAELALVDRSGGKVMLRRAVTELLDGAPPSEIRLVGATPSPPRTGAFRVSRDGRTDAAIEAELATQLGQIAVVEGDLATGLLEARLQGATAVSFAPPGARPRPWPRGAGLVLVLYGTPSAWVADVPNLTAS